MTFCFIVGSFAETCPNLRSPTSDIDIICSSDLNESKIRVWIQERFPNLPKDIPLDISIRAPEVDNSICFYIAYWQNEKYITLVNDSHVKLYFTKTDPDVPNCLRDPNKNALKEYLFKSKMIDFYKLGGLWKSISHYGEDEFMKLLAEHPLRSLILSIVEQAKDRKHANVQLRLYP